MTTQTNTERARPEAIKAVPVRHPGRWVAIAVIAVLAAMFIHLIVTNGQFKWSFIFSSYAPGKRGVMFTDPVLRGLRGTILLTITSMLIGIVLGVVVAIMRLSPNPILKWVAWGYTWVFRAVPRLVLAILFGNLGVLWPRVGFGIPFGEQIGHFFGLSDFSGQFYSIQARDLLAGFVAGMLALGLSEAAYMAEIVRAGIQDSRRRPPRSACPAARCCAGSCCHRRCGSSCRRPATRRSRWSRTPRWWPSCRSPRSCSSSSTPSAHARSSCCRYWSPRACGI
jgi:polar amino acid transport system permease protein